MKTEPKRFTHTERRERRSQIAEFVKNGGAVEEASRRFGVCYEVAHEACREFGVQPPRHVGIRCAASSFKILAALLNTDQSGTAIAAAFGVTRQRVDQIRKAAQDAGIKFRT